MGTVRALVAILLLLVAIPAHAQADLDAVVAQAMTAFDVPGMAVGVIHDGKLVFAKGYGVRKIGEPAPVTPETLFAIASNTKAFTAAALAILVDEKKLEWDSRVVDVLPSFQMADAYVTREMRIRDLLVHRSGLGLGAGDLMFFPQSNLTPAEVLRRLRFVPLATSFRSKYAYDNILYLAAGAVIEQASGMPWERFIAERIFQPLGMANSYATLRHVPAGGELAAPHVMVDGKLRAVAPDPLLGNPPAGAIHSSVNDVARWVTAQFNLGQIGEKRLFSEAQSVEMWTPHVFIPNSKLPDELAGLKSNFTAYALGWVVNEYRGHRVVTHTGGLNGMVTRVTMVPEQKLGIIVFTNQQEGAAFQAVTLSILDHYLRVPATDWVAGYAAFRKRQVKEANEKVAKASTGRVTDSKPSLPLAKYAGRYRDPWYGDVLVEEKSGKLSMTFTHSPSLSGPMEHFQYDTFIARWQDRSLDADAFVTFALEPEGAIASVRMKAVSPLTDFSYDFHDLALKPAPKDAKPY